MEKNTVFVLILIVILLTVLNIYQFFGNREVVSTDQISNTRQNIPSPSVINPPNNWELYTSSTLGFTINHPKEMKIYPQHGGAILFNQIGPTQVENTELFDGISLIFDVGDLNGKTLQQAAQEKLTEIKNQPTTERTEDIQDVTVGKYQGYKFFVRDMGERTYIYLPKGNSEYLVIIDSSTDPNGLGFKQTIDSMFATLNIQ